MHWQRSEPPCWPASAGVSVLEAADGEARDAVVARWLAQQRASGASAWRVRCAPSVEGPWSGLDALIEQIVPRVREQAPELLARHAHELCLVLPSLTSELVFPQSLTDTVDDDEKTRNYAADRAYRGLHGLIDLIDAWHVR